MYRFVKGAQLIYTSILIRLFIYTRAFSFSLTNNDDCAFLFNFKEIQIMCASANGIYMLYVKRGTVRRGDHFLFFSLLLFSVTIFSFKL
jgi:hypothetical protein